MSVKMDNVCQKDQLTNNSEESPVVE